MARISNKVLDSFKDVRFMRKSFSIFKTAISFAGILFFSLFAGSCSDDNDALPTYAGSPQMSSLNVESGTFIPKIAWAGGFVSVVGVNRGEYASLDNSLIWLIKADKNIIRYPVRLGSVPDGTVSIANQFGGTALDSLDEDDTYTYWVLKENMWDKIQQYAGRILKSDSTLDAEAVFLDADTLRISKSSFFTISQNIDVYPNIADFKTFGKLGKIILSHPVKPAGPQITWKISQAGVTDTLIAAIGIVEGQQFSEVYSKWKMYSLEVVGADSILASKNIIPPGLYLGQSYDGTITTKSFPSDGLDRGKNYYIWIASAGWDRVNYSRTTSYFAYATFRTW